MGRWRFDLRYPRLLATKARVADAERFGVEQHDGEPRRRVPPIDPGVIGAALDHDVAGSQRHRRLVHIHIDLAGEHDDIIDGLGDGISDAMLARIP